MRLPQDSRGEIRSFLQAELQTPLFLRHFNRLKKSHPELAQFKIPQDLLDCFNSYEIVRQGGSAFGMTSSPAERDSRNDRKENQSNLRNLWLRNRLLHILISYYRKQPKRKSWLMSLLLRDIIKSCGWIKMSVS